jgi:hypothetical protein
MDRTALDRTLSALGKRVFFMHNVHNPAPIVFETRWTLSYLRGPMSRDELRRLQVSQPIADAARSGQAPRPGDDADRSGQAPPLGAGADHSDPASRLGADAARSGDSTGTAAPRVAPGSAIAERPLVPAGVTEVFLPGARGRLVPVVYASARIHYTDAKRAVDTTRDVHVIAPFGDDVSLLDWRTATEIDVAPEDVSATAPEGATCAPVPAAALQPKQYAAWVKALEQWLARERPLRVMTAPALKLTSRPDESERDFRIRLQQPSREQRDAAVAKLRARYAPRLTRVTDKVRRAEAAIAREQRQVSDSKMQTAVSMGATLLGALMGRKAMSMSTLGRATTTARGVSRSMREQEDVARAEAQQRDAQAALDALQRELEAEIAAIASAPEPALETVEIKPKRGGVQVRLVALAWMSR